MVSLDQRVCALAVLIAISKLPSRPENHTHFCVLADPSVIILCQVCSGERDMWGGASTTPLLLAFSSVCTKLTYEGAASGAWPFSQTFQPGGFSPCLPECIVNTSFRVPAVCQELCPVLGTAVNKTTALLLWTLPSDRRRQTTSRQVDGVRGEIC